MKKIKWIIIGLVSLLFCFFLSEIFTKKNLDDRAEFKMAQSFLRSSSEVKKEFGDVQNLAYRRKFSKIIWNDGLASGEYAFELEGTKKSGIVGVKWSSHTRQFKPQEIELIYKYKLPERIWASQ